MSVNSYCRGLDGVISTQAGWLCSLDNKYPIRGGHFASASYANEGGKKNECRRLYRSVTNSFTRAQCLAHSRHTGTICYLNGEKKINWWKLVESTSFFRYFISILRQLLNGLSLKYAVTLTKSLSIFWAPTMSPELSGWYEESGSHKNNS